MLIGSEHGVALVCLFYPLLIYTGWDFLGYVFYPIHYPSNMLPSDSQTPGTNTRMTDERKAMKRIAKQMDVIIDDLNNLVKALQDSHIEFDRLFNTVKECRTNGDAENEAKYILLAEAQRNKMGSTLSLVLRKVDEDNSFVSHTSNLYNSNLVSKTRDDDINLHIDVARTYLNSDKYRL